MEIILQIAIVLLIGKFLGEIFIRVNLPETTAFIVTGILVGPIFGVAHMDVIRILGTISVLLLLFFAGLQGSFQGLKRPYFPFYIFAMVFSFGLGLIGTTLFGHGSLAGIVVGATLVTASISISLATLLESGQLRTRVGDILSSFTIISNIVGVAMIAFASSLAGHSSGGSLWFNLLLILGKIVLLSALFVALFYILPRITQYGDHLKTSHAQFTLLLVSLFFIAALVERLGFSMVLGAFVAGLVLGQARHVVSEDFLDNIRLLLGGFFLMFFFVMVGMQLKITPALLQGGSLLFMGVLLVGKFLSGYIGGIITHLFQRESLTLGSAMIPISINMGLAIMTIGKEAQLVNEELFSFFVAFTIITSVITPFLMSIPLRKPLPVNT